MSRPAPELYDLAGRILAAEAGISLEGIKLGDAAERACKKLRQYLAQLIGSYATQLLIKRALNKTVEEFPFLKNLEVDLDCRFDGLRDNMEKSSPGEVRDGLTTMLANFIGLLYEFIGEDLSLRLLMNAWPGISTGDLGSR